MVRSCPKRGATTPPDPAQGGRSLRARSNKTYVDDDQALLEALKRAEEYHQRHDVDERAAKTAGLPPYELADFERTCRALPEALRRRPADLCQLRNHILARAQRAPAKFLSLADAVKGLGAEYRGVPAGGNKAAQAAGVYECLTHHGHINFGVQEDHPRLASGRAPSAGAAGAGARRILVIGAGASGLAAARQLTLLGNQVTVLEGRARTGGRVHTVHLGGPGAGCDMGAMVVTGTEGNAIANVARQTGSRMHAIANRCRIYSAAGRPVGQALDAALEQEWNSLLDRCKLEAPPEPAADVSLNLP